jgi:hypothetical protein
VAKRQKPRSLRLPDVVEGDAGTEYERFADEFARIGASAACPICGRTDWRPPGILGNLLTALPTVTPSEFFAVEDADDKQGAIVTYAFTCSTCGFVRLHRIDAINDDAEQGP